MNVVIEFLNLRGGQFLCFAWPMVWQSGLLIALIFAVDFALRKRLRATVRYGLWMLVLAKLILPVSFSLPTGVSHWAPIPDSIALDEAISPPWLEEVPAPPPTTLSHTVLPRASLPAAVVPISIPQARLTLPGFVLTAWLCAIFVLTALFLLRAKQARRIAARAAATEEFSALLNACARQMNVHSTVGLRFSEALPTPAVCGLFHPVILLPKSLAAKLDPPQMRAVLLHELAHVRRKDLWVSLLQTVLQIFYFYNPFLWLASAAIRRAREEAVDEMVLVALADDAAVYPETLVNVAKLSLQSPRLAFGFAGILEGKSTLGARIRLMLHRPWPTTAKLGLPAALTLLVLGLILVPNGYSNRLNPTYQDPDEGISKTAEQWWDQLNFDKNESDLNEEEKAKDDEGSRAFVHLGKSAVHFLRKKLAQGNRREQSKAAFVLECMGTDNGSVIAAAVPELIAALKQHDGEASEYAAEALGEIGHDARAAVPALFDALQYGNGYGATCGALMRIDSNDPKLLPALLDVLRKFSGPVPIGWGVPNHMAFVVETMNILPGFGTNAGPAIPVLREMLQNSNGISPQGQYRFYAARTLLQIATNQPEIIAEANKVQQSFPSDNVVVSGLIDATEKAKGTADYPEALHKLSGAIGNAADHGTPISASILKEQVLPLFSAALDSGNQKAINYAVSGLWHLGPSAAPLLPKVINFAEQDDTHSLHFPDKIFAMRHIAPGDLSTLPTLLRVMNDTNATGIAFYNGSEALAQFGPEAAAALPGLHKFLEYAGNPKFDPSVKTAYSFSAMFALWRIAKEPPSVKLLQDVVRDNADGEDEISLRVLEMLGGLPTNAETKSLLRQLAQSTSSQVQTGAQALLKKIGDN